MVSVPEPPVRVSTLATVAELVRVGEGEGVAAGAEIDASRWTTVVARVMVSAPVPPIRVLVLLTVPVLPPVARVSLLAAGAEIDRHGGGQARWRG